jgi:Zn-dependent peptidase ImmA (M78 family)/plasmid maintenance system antidote protein VapI
LEQRDQVEVSGNLEAAVMDEPEFTPDWFSKPGDALRSLMIRRGRAVDDMARVLDGGMPTLRGLLDGTCAITQRHATVLAEHLGGTSSFWIKRQSNYEAALERAVDRAAATEGEDWLLLPVPGDKPRGRLTVEKRRAEIRRRLAFFNVGTLDAWEARYGRICSNTLFRKSPAFTANNGAVLMWLRSGELGADLVSTHPWSVGNLLDRLETIRKLSNIRQPERFLPKLKQLCAEAGVAVVAQRAPPGCPASGASRMVASDKAMVLLSFRGLSDDKFWFTVFHELGHLILHGAKTFVDADMEEIDESEREANEFASRLIVPESRSEEFGQLSTAREAVLRFSVSVGIAPGLTVGQMQHRQMIRRDQMNFLKRHWKWEDLDPILD